MNPQNKWLKVAGVVLNVSIAALMIFAGSGKVFGFAPPDVVEGMTKYGLGDRLQLIGLGEMTAAILLVIPRTSPFGTLLTSGFWGGVICIHMSHQENFVGPSVLLALTWLGAFLRGSVPLLAAKPLTRTSA
jgi:uncharacterized membrane protein YphA (DoxX/SURF4 family)